MATDSTDPNFEAEAQAAAAAALEAEQNAGASTAEEQEAPAAPPVERKLTGKGYRLDDFLPAEQGQYLEALAAHYGHTLPEFIARVMVLEDSEKEIECLKCKHKQKQVGVYPEIPYRPPEDSYATMLSVRLFRNRWVEIVAPGERIPKYICSICVTTNLMGVKLALRMLVHAFPGFTMDNDFLDELFKKVVPTHKALGTGQQALPAPKK